MHHFVGRGSAAVARRVLAKGRRRIEPYAPAARGLDVAGLVGQVLRWEAWLAEPQGEAPPLPAIRVIDPAEVA